MPAGSTRADLRFPSSLSGLGSLPERKVASAVFLILIDIDSGPIKNAGKVLLRKLAVFRELRDSEVVRTVFGAVCDAFLYQLGNELRHLLDVLGGANKDWLFNADHG